MDTDKLSVFLYVYLRASAVKYSYSAFLMIRPQIVGWALPIKAYVSDM